MSESGKLLKVTLEFENEVLTLDTPEDVAAWKSMVDSQTTMAYVHGARYEPLNWTKTTKEN